MALGVERLDEYHMARKGLMDVSGGYHGGRPRLCWMGGVKMALGSRMTVEALRECVKHRKEWRALVYM